MKVYFIILNIMLFLMISGTTLLHIYHKPPASDPILKKTPMKIEDRPSSIWNIIHPDIKNVSVISKKNLFEPRRGMPLPPPPKVKELDERQKKLIELVGICKIGDFRAAVIKNRAVRNRTHYSGTNKGKRPPPKKIKTFYKEGEKLENGYVVKIINFDSVVLSSGKDEFVLKLDRKDSASASRIKNVKITSAATTNAPIRSLPSRHIAPASKKIKTNTHQRKPPIPRFFRRRKPKRR